MCTRDAHFWSNTNANYLWDSTLATAGAVWYQKSLAQGKHIGESQITPDAGASPAGTTKSCGLPERQAAEQIDFANRHGCRAGLGTSELQAQGQLNYTGATRRPENQAKRSAVHVRYRISPARAVEGVEEIRPELDFDAFARLGLL